MVFFVVFSIMGLTFIEMGKFESIAGSNNYDQVKAFYNAQAGIHKRAVVGQPSFEGSGNVFPAMVVKMIATGEEPGSLEKR